MKKLLFSLLFFTAFANAQPIVNIPDADFKNYLLNEPTINTNGDAEIQVSEAEVVISFNSSLSNKNIASLQGIEAFVNLTILDAPYNQLTTLDLSGNLKLTHIILNNNNLSTLDLSANSLLLSLSVSVNPMTSLNVSGCTVLSSLEVYQTPLVDLDLSNKTQLSWLAIDSVDDDSALSGSLNISGCTALTNLSTFQNNLTSINASGCDALERISVWSPILQSVNLTGCRGIRDLEFSESVIATIDLSDCIALNSFNMSSFDNSNNNLLTIDFSNNPNLNSVYLSGTDGLRYVNLKNGSNEFIFIGSDALEFVCVDESQLVSVQEQFEDNVLISTYCSFIPGGNYNTITGKMRFDETNNGCDDTDFSSEYMKIKTNDGADEAATIVNATGDYNFYTNAGNFTLTPQFENPSYFTANPATATVNFPANDNSVSTQNFCTTVNGVHPDVEIVIVPLDFARPGFDSHYKIVYKNKGNQTLSGTISFNFDDAVLDFVSSSPAASVQATGLLTFNYSNLRPFENRAIALTLNANAPTEIPAVNIADVLVFSAAITPVTADETPDDNVFNFAQTVVGSFDPNDKQCIEGATLDTAHIGKYLHYVINFENTGTHVAENVVIKDTINTDQFDIESLQILNASAEMTVKINGNVIEFIFQAIHLPIGGHGNVLFKIKTKNNLPEGTIVTNFAEIFFDYNFPIVTNPAKTQFQTLATTVFDNNQWVSIYPNPTSNRVQIQSEIELKSVELYDVQGRLLIANEVQGKQAVIDISNQNAGLYLLKVVSDQGTVLKKIMKK